MTDDERDELRRLRGQVRRARTALRELHEASVERFGAFGDGCSFAAALLHNALLPRGGK